ncbi:hypothetical protein WKI68_40515 [Streptomyces sp. MS1.HAVA.3]|uniref:Uncharacterized protein n=1 Tax=Streptomyces caledonius TaxID=3134107 RepID=A0ABU8UD32_9ACTN
MVPAHRYAELDAALRRRGGELAVAPDAYRRAHELPGWYGTFTGLTPVSRWLPTAPGQTPDPGGSPPSPRACRPEPPSSRTT